MKIHNGDVLLFANTIISLNLKGKKQRLRTRLYLQLVDHYNNVIDKERIQLLYEYVEKNEHGELIYTDIERTQPLFKSDQLKDEFYREIEELYNEFHIIENNESNKEMLINICNILLDEECEVEVSGQFALVFDKWCEECEETLQFYNQQTESE